jgi:hypothetical protein
MSGEDNNLSNKTTRSVELNKSKMTTSGTEFPPALEQIECVQRKLIHCRTIKSGNHLIENLLWDKLFEQRILFDVLHKVFYD